MSSGAEIGVSLLAEGGVTLAPGLTGAELRDIERAHRFRFDPDHRELLSLVTPIGNGWFDWRASSTAVVQAHLEWPVDGVLWDVANNDYWPRAWGRRPATEAAREKLARRRLTHIPKLVPLFKARYMAAVESGGSAPVFSVMQTDVVYYGENLPSYIARELGIPKRYSTGAHRHISFWSALAEQDREYYDWPSGQGLKFRNVDANGAPFLPPFKEDGTPLTYDAFRSRDSGDSREVIKRITGAHRLDEQASRESE